MRNLFPLIPWFRRMFAVSLLSVVACGVCPAATLPFDVPLHILPDDDSPVVGTLPAETSITSLTRGELAAAGLDQPPAGWIALRSSGPFTGFVRNRDVADNGSIKLGAEIRSQPLADAPLLLVVESGDVTSAREPIGDWSRASVETDLFVYVNALPPASRSQMPDESVEVADEPAGETVAPHPPAVPGRSARPVKSRPTREPTIEPVPVETDAAPRTFVGYLVRTRRFLGRGPKFDYQLVDENNDRIAFLDVSALLAMSPVESYENHRISVYGPGLTLPGVKDLIIRVENLRLAR